MPEPIPFPADAASSATRRFAAIDALRGLGAVAIASYHIHRYGPVPRAADAMLPDFVQTLVDHGWLAVPMFLVVAGFVASYTLRNERLNLAAVANFALRRCLRLGTPYWIVLLLVLAMSFPAIWWPNDTSLTEPISWRQFLSCVFFLQDILGYGNVSAGMWFVCIDMQFGLLLVTLLWLGQGLRCGGAKGGTVDVVVLSAIFAPLALLSVFVFGLADKNDMWIHYFFYMPFLGMLAWWALEGRTPGWLFWTYVVLLVCGLVQRWCREYAASLADPAALGDLLATELPDEVEKLAVAILSGVAIHALGRAGHLGDWFRAGPLQYLGKISYSLFLIHYPVSWAVTTLGHRLTGDHPVAAVGWLLLAFLASVGAAHLLYRFVEAPSLRLVQRVKSRHKSVPA
jgi:peptidoglycan/LPS O-acetylase OafA/YrhL